MFPRVNRAARFAERVAEEIRKTPRSREAEVSASIFGYEDEITYASPKVTDQRDQTPQHVDALVREMSLALATKDIELEAQTQELAKRQQALETATAENETLRQEISTLKQNLERETESRKREAASMQQRLADKNMECEEVASRHQQNLARLVREVGEVQLAIDRCQVDIQSKDDEIRVLVGKLDESNRTKDRLEAQNSSLNARLLEQEKQYALLLDKLEAAKLHPASEERRALQELKEKVEWQSARYDELVASMRSNDLRSNAISNESTAVDMPSASPSTDDRFDKKIEGLKELANELRQVTPRTPIRYEGQEKLEEIKMRLRDTSGTGTFHEFLKAYQAKRS